MIAMIVFGIGTGRCGTASLANLLNKQNNAAVFHELNPGPMSWTGAEAYLEELLGQFESALETGKLDVEVVPRRWNLEALDQLEKMDKISMVGDIGLYYLPYVEYILSKNPSVKFVGLRRDEDATVKSYLRKTMSYRYPKFLRFLPGAVKVRNHWIDHDGSKWTLDLVWDKCYPKYDAATKEEALHLYWRDYYAQTDELEKRYPGNVRVWDLEAMNSGESQKEVLDFIGIPEADQVLEVGLRVNVKRD